MDTFYFPLPLPFLLKWMETGPWGSQRDQSQRLTKANRAQCDFSAPCNPTAPWDLLRWVCSPFLNTCAWIYLWFLQKKYYCLRLFSVAFFFFFFAGKNNSVLLITPCLPTKRFHEKLCYGHQRGGKAAGKLPGFAPSPWTPSRLHTHQEEWPGLHSLLTTNSIAAAKAQVLTSLLTSIAAFTNTTHVHQVRSSLGQGLQISKEK